MMFLCPIWLHGAFGSGPTSYAKAYGFDPHLEQIFSLLEEEDEMLCENFLILLMQDPITGYEGGLYCVYIAEVWANEGLVVNSTNSAAVWNLRRLGAKRQLKVVVYAANARGRSEHVTFIVETAPRLSPRTGKMRSYKVYLPVLCGCCGYRKGY